VTAVLLYCQSCIKVHHVHVSLHISSFFLLLLLLPFLLLLLLLILLILLLFLLLILLLLLVLLFLFLLFTTTCTLLNWLVKIAVFLYSFLVTWTQWENSVTCNFPWFNKLNFITLLIYCFICNYMLGSRLYFF